MDGIWQGINLTYYGFFNAVAYLFAVALFLIMTGSLSITIVGALSVVLPVLAICMPAARFIARLVEKKQHTFSVGGASFTGILIAPWIIKVVNLSLGKWLGFHMPVGETLAAMFIAYAFGEGLGRLACISFGCCYGKPLSACSPLMKRIFRQWNFVFWGSDKENCLCRRAGRSSRCSRSGIDGCYLYGERACELLLILKRQGSHSFAGDAAYYARMAFCF